MDYIGLRELWFDCSREWRHNLPRMGSQCRTGPSSGRLQYVWLCSGLLKKHLLNVTDNWDPTAIPMTKNDFGVWEVTLSAIDGSPVIPHNTKVKVHTSLVIIIWSLTLLAR